MTESSNGTALVAAEITTAQRPSTGGWDMRLDKGVPTLVEAPLHRSKVAIVGFSASSRAQAPYDDPTVEIWGLNQLYNHIPRASRWFEMHRRAMFLADQVEGTDYLAWLRACPVPVYMIDEPEDVPSAVAYPLANVQAHFGRRYFTSTPALMLALACYLGFTEVALYGIDLTVGDEWGYQKPCMEYLIGFLEGWSRAQGHAVTLHIPSESALMKVTHHYGYDDEPQTGHIKPGMLIDRKRRIEEQQQHVADALYKLDGALYETQHLLTRERTPDAAALFTDEGRRVVAERIAALAKRREEALTLSWQLAARADEVAYWDAVLDLSMKGGYVGYGPQPDGKLGAISS